MPSIVKPSTEKLIERIHTAEGEVTINLNLKLTIEAGDIVVKADAVSQGTKEAQEKAEAERRASPDFIPEEQFDLEIPVVQGFGKNKDEIER